MQAYAKQLQISVPNTSPAVSGIPSPTASQICGAYYRPERHLRDAPLVPSGSVLVFIDLQNYNCALAGAINTASCGASGAEVLVRASVLQHRRCK